MIIPKIKNHETKATVDERNPVESLHQHGRKACLNMG
jgi:hypothetical protein